MVEQVLDIKMTQEHVINLISSYIKDSHHDFYKSSEYGKNNVDNLDVNLDDNSKLNNILEILENQKEIRTEQKTEEIILFFFIGIFIIYIIDSFASIGKYSR